MIAGRLVILLALALRAAEPVGEARPRGLEQSAPERFTVVSDGHPLAVWARRPASPRAAMVLVHGRTWSSLPDFDLQVPGLQRSTLAALARNGIAAYAVDLRGYGETKRDATGWLTPRRSAADIVNVLNWVAQQYPGLPKPALLGWSRGAVVSMLAAQTAPRSLSALIVYGFAFDPDLDFVDADPPAKPAMIRNTAKDAASDFVSPKVTPQAVVDAFVAQALRSDPVSMDLRNDGELNAIDPARIAMPTLLIFGERDVNVPPMDGAKLFARLGTADKQMVELPGADHVAHLEDTHDAWMAAVVNFVTRPAVRR
ncbi:MAG: alpha/beta fold hydrolase [Acidobacteria bacterium]|nr:alpha/beta fold hydrolase [Acidobacteriota bacterium]